MKALYGDSWSSELNFQRAFEVARVTVDYFRTVLESHDLLWIDHFGERKFD